MSCSDPVDSPTSIIFSATSGTTPAPSASRQPLTFADPLRHDIELFRHVVIADGSRRHLERIHQRDATSKQRRKRARHLRRDEFARGLADERDRQHEVVEPARCPGRRIQAVKTALTITTIAVTRDTAPARSSRRPG